MARCTQRKLSHTLSAKDPIVTLQTLLVAVDGSESSTKLVAWAKQLVSGRDARIILLHVLAPSPHLPLDSCGLTRPRLHDAQMAWGRSILDSLAERVQGHAVEKVIESGSPAEVICAQAEERNADLILVGSRGMGAVGRWYLGSVSNRVVQQSKRPVFVVP